jgi:UTP-glucose-1-phosphate uridylyltransferase
MRERAARFVRELWHRRALDSSGGGHLGKIVEMGDGEIQLTDAMITLSRRQPFYGLKFHGRSFDCGSKIGFLAANIAYALARDDIAPALRAEIKSLLG